MSITLRKMTCPSAGCPPVGGVTGELHARLSCIGAWLDPQWASDAVVPSERRHTEVMLRDWDPEAQVPHSP